MEYQFLAEIDVLTRWISSDVDLEAFTFQLLKDTQNVTSSKPYSPFSAPLQSPMSSSLQEDYKYLQSGVMWRRSKVQLADEGLNICGDVISILDIENASFQNINYLKSSEDNLQTIESHLFDCSTNPKINNRIKASVDKKYLKNEFITNTQESILNNSQNKMHSDKFSSVENNQNVANDSQSIPFDSQNNYEINTRKLKELIDNNSKISQENHLSTPLQWYILWLQVRISSGECLRRLIRFNSKNFAAQKMANHLIGSVQFISQLKQFFSTMKNTLIESEKIKKNWLNDLEEAKKEIGSTLSTNSGILAYQKNWFDNLSSDKKDLLQVGFGSHEQSMLEEAVAYLPVTLYRFLSHITLLLKLPFSGQRLNTNVNKIDNLSFLPRYLLKGGQNKMPKSHGQCEDATLFLREGVFGVFDGVGSWTLEGIDASKFSEGLSEECILVTPQILNSASIKTQINQINSSHPIAISPSSYQNSIMERNSEENCKKDPSKLACEFTIFPPLLKPSISPNDIARDILHNAHIQLQKNRPSAWGSSTAVVAVFDSLEGRLGVASLGDSSLFLLRRATLPNTIWNSSSMITPSISSPNSPFVNTSTQQTIPVKSTSAKVTSPIVTNLSSSTANNNHFSLSPQTLLGNGPHIPCKMRRILWRTTEQRWENGAPYQLTNLPKKERWEDLRRKGYHRFIDTLQRVDISGDSSDMAHSPQHPLSCQPGDLILVFSDGVSDNLFDEEVETFCSFAVSPEEASQLGDSSLATDPENIAKVITIAAKRRSTDQVFKQAFVPLQTSNSHYSRFARAWNNKGHFKGCKKDDISCVACWVVAETQESLNALLAKYNKNKFENKEIITSFSHPQSISTSSTISSFHSILSSFDNATASEEDNSNLIKPNNSLASTSGRNTTSKLSSSVPIETSMLSSPIKSSTSKFEIHENNRTSISPPDQIIDNNNDNRSSIIMSSPKKHQILFSSITSSYPQPSTPTNTSPCSFNSDTYTPKTPNSATKRRNASAAAYWAIKCNPYATTTLFSDDDSSTGAAVLASITSPNSHKVSDADILKKVGNYNKIVNPLHHLSPSLSTSDDLNSSSLIIGSSFPDEKLSFPSIISSSSDQKNIKMSKALSPAYGSCLNYLIPSPTISSPSHIIKSAFPNKISSVDKFNKAENNDMKQKILFSSIPSSPLHKNKSNKQPVLINSLNHSIGVQINTPIKQTRKRQRSSAIATPLLNTSNHNNCKNNDKELEYIRNENTPIYENIEYIGSPFNGDMTPRKVLLVGGIGKRKRIQK